MTARESEWRWRFLLARDARTESARRRLAARATAGEIVRVIPGAYLPTGEWRELGPNDRYVTKLRATQATRDETLVFSHQSAVALWGLPTIGRPPVSAHVVAERSSGRGSTSSIRRHFESAGNPVEIDGLLVTSLARTVVDIAREADLARAVVVADAALNAEIRETLRHREAEPDLQTELLRIPVRHGSARARHVIDFADGRSGSPGESLSRLTIDVLGLPSPVLQHSFPRPGGGRWPVDFWWPEFEIIGEFDGASKYLDPAFRGGRTPEQVVLDEKRREDHLRSLVRGFARWGWAAARSPAELAARLRRAGFPI